MLLLLWSLIGSAGTVIIVDVCSELDKGHWCHGNVVLEMYVEQSRCSPSIRKHHPVKQIRHNTFHYYHKTTLMLLKFLNIHSEHLLFYIFQRIIIYVEQPISKKYREFEGNFFSKTTFYVRQWTISSCVIFVHQVLSGIRNRFRKYICYY